MFFFLDNVNQGMASYAKETSLNQDMFLKTSRKGLRTKVSVAFMTCYEKMFWRSYLNTYLTRPAIAARASE